MEAGRAIEDLRPDGCGRVVPVIHPFRYTPSSSWPWLRSLPLRLSRYRRLAGGGRGREEDALLEDADQRLVRRPHRRRLRDPLLPRGAQAPARGRGHLLERPGRHQAGAPAADPVDEERRRHDHARRRQGRRRHAARVAAARGTAAAASGGGGSAGGPIPDIINAGKPAHADSVPIPLLVLGGVALVLMLAGAAGFLARRLRLRRSSPPRRLRFRPDPAAPVRAA